jgi:hypothetical protein
MNKDAKKPTKKNYIKGLNLCFGLGLALLALPVFCALNSKKKKLTNEEVILNWLTNKSRKGKSVKKAEPAAQNTAGSQTIKEEQIKEVDKTDDGWLVITNENRVLLVPRTDR